MNKTLKYAGVLVAVVAVASITILLMNGLALPSGGQSEDFNLPNENALVTITYGKGATCPKGELYIDVHIKNDGYDNFRPSGSQFVLTIGSVDYQYDFSGSKLLGWQNVDIANGEKYDASIAFKVPDSSAAFVLNYTSTEYKILCQPE